MRYINVIDFMRQQAHLQQDQRFTLDKSKFIFTQSSSANKLVYAYCPVDEALQTYITTMRKQELKQINFLHTLAGGSKKIKFATTTKLTGKVVL